LHGPELPSPLARQALAQPGFFCRDHLIIPDQHRILDLPADHKGFLATLPQNERYQQRKRERRLAKEFKEIRIDRFASPENIDLLIAQAEAVARKSYQRKIGVGFAASDFMRAWLEFFGPRGLAARLRAQPRRNAWRVLDRHAAQRRVRQRLSRLRPGFRRLCLQATAK
jgi:hypothetical protein